MKTARASGYTKHMSATKEWAIAMVRAHGGGVVGHPELSIDDTIDAINALPGSLVPMCDCKGFDPETGCPGFDEGSRSAEVRR